MPADPPDEHDLPDDLSYGQAIDDLERILDDLEADELDIDLLADQVRRAAALIRFCRGRIEDARVEVEQIVADLDDEDPGDGPPSG
jgi:exodeoxyribonuclease VII small subunit